MRDKLQQPITQPRRNGFPLIILGIGLAIWLLVLAFTAYRYIDKASKPSRLGTLTRTAILRWKDQVQDLMAGKNVYPPGNPYPNPPIMAIILSPLYTLSPLQTAITWFVLKLGMALLALYWTYQLLGPIHEQVHGVIWALIGVFVFGLCWHPIFGDLSHGNVNIFIAFLVIATLAAYERGWDWLAGLILGLAIACKITPLLFVPYFGWKWILACYDRFQLGVGWLAALFNPGLRVLAGTGLGLILWFLVVPGFVLGFEQNQTFLQSWYTGMVRPFLVEGKITSEHANQSLPGYLVRMLTNQPSTVDYDADDRAIATHFHNIAEWPAEAVRGIVRGAQVLFVFGLMLWCGRRSATRSDSRRGLGFAAECAYIVMGMLLFSERTWKHHGVVLMLPYAVLGAALVMPKQPRQTLCYAIVMLHVAGLTLIPSMLPEEWQNDALAYGTHTWAYLLLLLGVVITLHTTLRSDAPSRVET